MRADNTHHLTEAARRRAQATRLAGMPLADLVRTLGGLAAESKVFDNLVERATLRADLARLGLEPLLDLRLRAGEGVGACLGAQLLLSGLLLRAQGARTS